MKTYLRYSRSMSFVQPRLGNSAKTGFGDRVHPEYFEGAQMGSSRRDRDIAKLRKNSQNVNRQIWLRNFCLILLN